MWKVGSEQQLTTSLPLDPVDPVEPLDPVDLVACAKLVFRLQETLLFAITPSLPSLAPPDAPGQPLVALFVRVWGSF